MNVLASIHVTAVGFLPQLYLLFPESYENDYVLVGNGLCRLELCGGLNHLWTSSEMREVVEGVVVCCVTVPLWANPNLCLNG